MPSLCSKTSQGQSQPSVVSNYHLHPKELRAWGALLVLLLVARFATLVDPEESAATYLERNLHSRDDIEQAVQQGCELDTHYLCGVSRRRAYVSAQDFKHRTLEFLETQNKLPQLALIPTDCDHPTSTFRFRSHPFHRIFATYELKCDDSAVKDSVRNSDVLDLEALKTATREVLLVAMHRFARGRSLHLVWFRGKPETDPKRVLTVGLQMVIDFLCPKSGSRQVFWKNESAPSLVVLPSTLPVPIGRLDRKTVVEILAELIQDNKEDMLISNEWDANFFPEVVEELQQSELDFDYTPPETYQYERKLSPLALHHPYSQHLQCLQEFQRRDLITSRVCNATLTIVNHKLSELEIYWDFPIAVLMVWVYTFFGILVLMILIRDLGHHESKVARKRRQFRMALEDSVLRRCIEKKLEKEVGAEHVAERMAQLDDKAAKYAAEEEQSDEAWQRQEARLMAWKERVANAKVVRKGALFPLGISTALLYFDSPQMGCILDGLMVAVGLVICTYCFLPKHPEGDSKKTATSEDASTPLLGNRDREQQARLV